MVDAEALEFSELMETRRGSLKEWGGGRVTVMSWSLSLSLSGEAARASCVRSSCSRSSLLLAGVEWDICLQQTGINYKNEQEQGRREKGRVPVTAVVEVGNEGTTTEEDGWMGKKERRNEHKGMCGWERHAEEEKKRPKKEPGTDSQGERVCVT